MQTAIPRAAERELITRVDDVTDPRYGCAPENRPMSLRIKYGIINIDKPRGPRVMKWWLG